MERGVSEYHELDAEGRPDGGTTVGRGIEIHWQRGPLGRGLGRREPNGAFVEGVLAAALGRLEHYQGTEFGCPENALAIVRIEEALAALDSRTRDREQRGVEGTHDL